MSQLITCVECGKRVSSNVERCPHCQKDPRIIHCWICGQQMKKSEGKSLNLKNEPVNYTLCHESCILFVQKPILSQTFQCPLCHCQISYQYAEEHIQNGSVPGGSVRLVYCPECGEGIYPLYGCYYCGVLISEKDKVEIHSSLHHGGMCYILSVHRACKQDAKRSLLNCRED